jgi:hypothetical protein
VTSDPAGLLLAAAYWMPRARASAGVRWFCGTTLALALAVTVLLHGDHVPGLKPEKDPILRLRGWPDLAAKVDALRDRYRPDLVIANNYGNASEISFYGKGKPTVFLARTDMIENQFSFWPGYAVAPGQKALYVTNELDYPMPASFGDDFTKIEEVADFHREHGGRPIDEYKVWLLTR